MPDFKNKPLFYSLTMDKLLVGFSLPAVALWFILVVLHKWETKRVSHYHDYLLVLIVLLSCLIPSTHHFFFLNIYISKNCWFKGRMGLVSQHIFFYISCRTKRWGGGDIVFLWLFSWQYFVFLQDIRLHIISLKIM